MNGKILSLARTNVLQKAAKKTKIVIWADTNPLFTSFPSVSALPGISDRATAAIRVIRGRLKNYRARLRVDEAPIKSPSYG